MEVRNRDGKEIKVGCIKKRGSRELGQGRKESRRKRWRGDGKFQVVLWHLRVVQNKKMLKIRT